MLKRKKLILTGHNYIKKLKIIIKIIILIAKIRKNPLIIIPWKINILKTIYQSLFSLKKKQNKKIYKEPVYLYWFNKLYLFIDNYNKKSKLLKLLNKGFSGRI